jgi:ATP-binding protein involved in chromosome partitioning
MQYPSLKPLQITGIVLNQSHFICSSCSTPHYLYGSPNKFRATAERMGVPILAEIPVLPGMSSGGDAGVPFAIHQQANDAKEWKDVMLTMAASVWDSMQK